MIILERATAAQRRLVALIGVMAWTLNFLVIALAWAQPLLGRSLSGGLLAVRSFVAAAVLSALSTGFTLLVIWHFRRTQQASERRLIEARRAVADAS